MNSKERIPECPRCGSQDWYRLHQYLQTDRETIGPTQGDTVIQGTDNVSIESDEVVQGWTCWNEHTVHDEDIIDRLDDLA